MRDSDVQRYIHTGLTTSQQICILGDSPGSQTPPGPPPATPPDWSSLAFGAPLITVSGGVTLTFTPDNSSGNVITSNGSQALGSGAGHGYAAGPTPTPVGATFSGTPNEGTLTFDSTQDFNCNLHLSITKSGPDISGTQSWIQIYNLVNPGFDLELNFSLYASGEYDIPFTIANQSTDSLQEFVDIVTSFTSSTDLADDTYKVVATLTNL